MSGVIPPAQLVGLDEVRAAAERIADLVLRSPVIALPYSAVAETNLIA